MLHLPTGRSGGIGRRTRLKIARGDPWGFDSPLRHKIKEADAKRSPTMILSRGGGGEPRRHEGTTRSGAGRGGIDGATAHSILEFNA